MRVEPLRLQKDLMPVAIPKAVYLILDRRAVTRSCRTDCAGEQRRAVQVGADRIVRGLRRACDRAEHLRVGPAFG